MAAYFPPPIPRFTILRHPVTQFLSYFFMRPMGHQVIQTVHALHQSINRSLPHGLHQRFTMITNSQVRKCGHECVIRAKLKASQSEKAP